MTRISRTYTFSAAHRIEGHPKCGRLHGHNYILTVEVSGEIREDGMVLDYGELDVIVKPVVEAMDHRYIVSRTNRNAGDPYLLAAVSGHREDDIFDLPCQASTAEEMCIFLHKAFSARLPGLKVAVGLKETPRSDAHYP